MKVAYSRVSSLHQNIAPQIEILKNYGCEKIYQEKVSGTSTQNRNQLKECLDFVRDGDELVVTRIDRLARSILDLQLIVKQLSDKGVTLTATEQPISTKDATSRYFLDMLSVFSSFETNIRRERQLEGIAKAKANGVYKGGKQVIDIEKIKKLKKEGLGATAIAIQIGCHRDSIYRLLKQESK